MDWQFTGIKERRDGSAANQVLEEQTLPSDEDGNKSSQGVVKRQVTDLEENADKTPRLSVQRGRQLKVVGLHSTGPSLCYLDDWDQPPAQGTIPCRSRTQAQVSHLRCREGR